MTGLEPLDAVELEAFRRFIWAKVEKHVISLAYYYNPAFAGFYHKHEKDKQKMSMASTSTAVLSLVRAGKWNDGEWKEHASDTVRIFLTAPWTSASLPPDNPFTVAFELEAVTALVDFLPAKLDPELQDQIVRAEKLLMGEIKSGSVSVLGYPPSAYLTQLVSRVLRRRGAINGPLADAITEWAWREVDHQLALLQAQSKTADLYQLAYCLVIVADVDDPGEATPDQSAILLTALDIFLINNCQMALGQEANLYFTIQMSETLIVMNMSYRPNYCKADSCKIVC